MHELLKKALDKAGVDNVSQLTEEEKLDYDRYAKVLDKPDLSLDDVLTFCRAQKTLVESQFGNLDDSPQKRDRLLTLHFVYSKVVWFIMGDKAERQAVERELTDLIDRP